MSSLLKFPIYFVTFVALGLIFGYLTFKVLSFSRTVEVPQVVNKTLVQANEDFSRAGLYLKIEGEDFDSVIPAGRIIRQEIPAGNKVKEKRAIKVVVSKGPRVSAVPYLVGQSTSEAETLLLEKGLKIGKTIYVHSSSAEKGKIVAQRPEADERLTDMISVLVSLGPYQVTYSCPDFTGKTLNDAEDLAKKMGLALEKKGESGIVIGQKPKPGSVIKTGETVHLDLKEGE